MRATSFPSSIRLILPLALLGANLSLGQEAVAQNQPNFGSTIQRTSPSVTPFNPFALLNESPIATPDPNQDPQAAPDPMTTMPAEMEKILSDWRAKGVVFEDASFEAPWAKLTNVSFSIPAKGKFPGLFVKISEIHAMLGSEYPMLALPSQADIELRAVDGASFALFATLSSRGALIQTGATTNLSINEMTIERLRVGQSLGAMITLPASITLKEASVNLNVTIADASWIMQSALSFMEGSVALDAFDVDLRNFNMNLNGDLIDPAKVWSDLVALYPTDWAIRQSIKTIGASSTLNVNFAVDQMNVTGRGSDPMNREWTASLGPMSSSLGVENGKIRIRTSLEGASAEVERDLGRAGIILKGALTGGQLALGANLVSTIDTISGTVVGAISGAGDINGIAVPISGSYKADVTIPWNVAGIVVSSEIDAAKAEVGMLEIDTRRYDSFGYDLTVTGLASFMTLLEDSGLVDSLAVREFSGVLSGGAEIRDDRSLVFSDQILPPNAVMENN